MRRFYSSPDSFNGDTIELDEASTKHLRGVLRLSAGDRIAIFDGEGSEYECSIQAIEKSSTLAKIINEIEPPSPESPLHLTLAAALTKNDKFDLVIQKAAELGVNELIPFISRRCDIKVKDSNTRHERWQRIALEASKQCGRATVMQVSEITEFDHLIKAENNIVMFSERSGGSLTDVVINEKVLILVGPEGGWEDNELELAASQRVNIVTLGGRILRAETAAIIAAGLMQHRFGDIN